LTYLEFIFLLHLYSARSTGFLR